MYIHVGGQLDCLQFLTVTNKDARMVVDKSSYGHLLSFFLGNNWVNIQWNGQVKMLLLLLLLLLSRFSCVDS